MAVSTEKRGLFQPDATTVFVVSGGAKGITASCVAALSQRYGSRFILVGRSQYDETPEPAWAENEGDERGLRRRAMAYLQKHGKKPDPQTVRAMARRILSRREIARTLHAVAEGGGEAVYARADVTDGPGLREAVEGALHRLDASGVDGLIHGAGVIADRRIEEKTSGDFDLVYGVKVDGLKNLLHIVETERLRFVVLFSSVAGFYGNSGQADYALANAVLDKTAHWLTSRYPSCRVLALDWGPWDGGMVTPALKRMMEQRGIDLIPVETGTAVLTGALAREADPSIQQVIGASLGDQMPTHDGSLSSRVRSRRYHIERRLSLEANPFLRDHVIGGQAVMPTVCAVAWMINACEQLTPGYDFTRVTDYKVYKGLVFDESLAPVHRLAIQEVEAEDGLRVFDTLITSETETGLRRNHYSARIELRNEWTVQVPAVPVDLDEIDPIPGERLYEDGVLFHGPSFRGVQRVLRLDGKGLIAECRLPPIPRRAQGQFPVQTFNPYLADVQLQSLLIWANHTYGYGGLPLKIQGSAYYRNPDFGETTYASLAVRSHAEHRLVADVTIHDAEGWVYGRVTGAEITMSARLNPLFAQNELRGVGGREGTSL